MQPLAAFSQAFRRIDWSRRDLRDAVAICVFALTAYFFIYSFGLFSKFAQFVRANAGWNVGGILVLSFLLNIALLVYGVRRLRDFTREIAARRGAEAEVTEQVERLNRSINNMSQGLLLFDAAERLIVCNSRYLQIYGLSADVVKPGITLRNLLRVRIATGSFSSDPAIYRADMLAARQHRRTISNIIELKDGRTIEIINQPMPDGGWVATHEDISERRRAERELNNARNFLNTIVENVPATLVVKDAKDLRYVLVNRAGEELFGRPRAEMLGKSASDLLPADVAEEVEARDRAVVATNNQIFVDEHPLQPSGTQTRLITSKRVAIKDEHGEPQYLLGVIEDVTERRKAQDRIEHMAHHDELTDLPNRAAFNTRLAETLNRAAAANEPFAVLCVDLDRFKEVNDLFGHSVGDGLLCEVARRMSAASSGAFLARIGGDEFTLIAADSPQPGGALALAEALFAAMAEAFDIDHHRLRVGLSIGVAVYPNDGENAATLLANADAALYRSKAEGRNSVRFFEPDMDKRLRERRALQHDLRTAIEREELTLYYQPQAIIGGAVVGFEALARWRHPTRGMVSPATFIPLAEESGVILPMGEWILREACREAASWPNPLNIAVNLSPVQFRHGDLVGMIHTTLLETGLAPHRLEIEVTEGVLIDDFTRAVAILRRIKALGVRIAMDDFGTGYSSLSYLQSFPFDKIKIDKAFIANLDRNPQSAAIIRAVIGLARGLHLPVIAEGVETEEQLAFLSREDCDEVQGYLVGHPLPADDYAELIGRTVTRSPVARAG